ncbi:MAG: DciA family protein [Candidatus Brocadiaceae bacterium]|nr:DciA family protein [Candidatus Brocadiaceae bacterium]
MSQPKEIRDVLQRVLPGLKPPRGRAMERLQTAWREVTTGKTAGQSRVKQLKQGVLIIEADSAPMIHHLSEKDKECLLEELRRKVAGIYIKEIRTRLARE